jgi:hypothetical protein
MTGASDGAGPALTRAERRRKLSRAQRRRARRTARRRDTAAAAEESTTVGAAPERAPRPPEAASPAPSPLPPVSPAPAVVIDPPVPAPAPARRAPAPAAEAEPVVTRRARRSRRSAKLAPGRTSVTRDRTADPSAPEVAPVPTPLPASATAPVPEAVSARAPVERRTRSARPRRTAGDRRFWTRVMPAIAGVLIVAVVVGAVVRSGDDDAATGSDSGGPDATVDQQPVLFVHQGTAGTDLIAVADRDGGRGSVLFVPVATQLDVPAEGVTTLGDIPTADSGAQLTNSVENVLGVGVGKTVILDDAALTAALGPAAPIPITLTSPVEFSDRSVGYRAGAQSVSAAQASELMGAPQSVNELDRLVGVAAVVDGWMDRLQDPEIAQATLALQPGLAPLVDAAQAEDRRLDTAPVASIATGGDERFNIRGEEMSRVARRAFPRSLLGVGGRRPRVEILNGTGALGVARAVADKIVPAGGRFVRSDNLPGFGLGQTQVVYYSDEWRRSAQQLLDAMGCGSLRKAGRDPHVSDVTILVGADCPAYGAPGGGT